MNLEISTLLTETIRIVNELLKLIVCTAAVSTMSVTLSKAGVFAPLRRTIKSRSKWLGKLLDCPYCTSHWMAFGVTAVFQPRPVMIWLPVDLLLSAFAMVALSPIFAGLIFRLYEGLLEGDQNGVARIEPEKTGSSRFIRPPK
jgi:hypothetical protein